MFVQGHYVHAIDAKQRIAIPAQVRALWNKEEDGDAFVAVPWKNGIIRLYAEKDFRNRVKSGFLTYSADEDPSELQARLISNTDRLEMDSAGRIRLPEHLLEVSGLGNDVVLLGCGDRLEIRDRAKWKESHPSDIEQVPELFERISARHERGVR